MRSTKALFGLLLVIVAAIGLLYGKAHPLWIIPSFPLSWVGGSFLFAYLSGWDWLADRYRTSEPAPNSLSGMCRGKIGWVAYRNCLNIGASDKGLYLSLFPLFALRHPPVLIPWEQVGQVQAIRYLFAPYYRLKVGNITLKLPQSALAPAAHILEQKLK